MTTRWDERHGKILLDFFKKLSESNIKWFILRGYEGLPNINPSKDVDIMIETGKEPLASALLKQTFEKHNVSNLHKDCFGHIHCYIGMDTLHKLSIHID